MAVSISIIIHNKEYEVNSDIYNYEMIATSFDDEIGEGRISEFLFWYSLKYITKIFDSFGGTLIFIDAILCILQILSIRAFANYFLDKNEINNIGYLYFGFIIFYTQLNGLYLFRQYCAVTLFIAALVSFLEDKKIKSSIILLASILTHNSIILISPLLLSVKYFKLSIILIIAMNLSLVYVGRNNEIVFRHDVVYENTLSFLYLFIYLIIFISMNFMILTKSAGSDYKVIRIYRIIYGVALTYILSFMIFENNLTRERIGLLLMVFLFISIPIIIEKLKFKKVFLRLVFIIVANIPMLTFYNNLLIK